MRTLVTLGILIVALFATIFAGTKLDARSEDNPSGASLTPGLALDLEGGTQIILTPVTTDGSQVTDETVNQAINVIRQRVDSSGVAEAEITSQGGRNIVVGIPGKASDETIELVSKAAQMRFRPVLTYAAGTPTVTDTPTDTPTDAATEGATDTATEGTTEGATDPSAEPTEASEQAEAATDGTEPAATETAAPADGATATPSPSASSAPVEASDPSDLAQITPEIQERFAALDCTDPANLAGGGGDDADAVLTTCSDDGTVKYILGPVEIEGTDISNASSGLRTGPNGAVTNEWVVNIEFNSAGTRTFTDITTRLQGLESPRNQFAMVLDGLVISAPSLSPGTIIADGRAEISGTFTRESAATLANQLNFGSLPLTFQQQSVQQISATLGSEQLEKGLIAGLIGLALVVVYSLFQYRTLGLVTVASLVVAAIITYGLITLLSWTQGYRLSLPGVAGLIVAIGITADSFIVYFERIRDELRDGRTLNSAVERGWERARRTILASDTVNFLAAVVLYFLAVGGVRGFAFTLGLTTLVDIVVVFLFTHPLMQLLAKTKFFSSGHPASGLDPRRLGVTTARYAGRGRVVRPTADSPAVAEPVTVADEVVAGPAADAPAERDVPVEREPVAAGTGPRTDASGRRLTIAERRAAERRAALEHQDRADGQAADAADAAQGDENEEQR